MDYRYEWGKTINKCEYILKNSKEEHSMMFKGDTSDWKRAYEIVNDKIFRQKLTFALNIINKEQEQILQLNSATKRYLIDNDKACCCVTPLVGHPRHDKAGELKKCGGCRLPFRIQFKE
jgi:hypothetical protein